MSEWNFMTYESKDNLLRAVRNEFAGFSAFGQPPGAWEAPTACTNWQVRDVVGHLVDTTERYFVSFDAARGSGEASDPLGLRDMGRLVDEGARAFRGTPQPEMLERLRVDFSKMMETFDGLSAEDWGGLMVPHKYMGPLPAFFYPVFQLVDYAVHNWDLRQGTGQAHGLDGDSADLLVPLCFILWQATADIGPRTEPAEIGVRVSGRNGGDTRIGVSPDGLTFEPGAIDGLPAVIEFDPASLVLTAFGRLNAGTSRGDTGLVDRFRNLFFKI